MGSPTVHHSQNSPKKIFDVPRAIGCCAGQSLGCGFTFLLSWAGAWIFSSLLVPLLGQSQGGRSTVVVLITGLTCGTSLLLGAGLSYTIGRIFPVFKRKGE
jgi:hypothetical protein